MQHGTGHTKPTALFLHKLSPIQPTCMVDGREPALARLPSSADRAELRSRTYLGIAGAMAQQWMDDRCLRSTVRSYSTYRLVAVWTRRVRSDVVLVSVGPPHERDALGG